VLTTAVGEMLPSAIAIALSPIPIIAVVVVLSGQHGRANGPVFLIGWLAGLSALTAIVMLLTGDSSDPESTTSTVVDVVRLMIGTLLLLLAVREWRHRPGPGATLTEPAWMAKLGTAGPGRTFVFGAAVGGVNPKNAILTVAAAVSISQVGLDTGEATIAGVVFVALSSLTVIAVVGAHVALGERAEHGLGRLKEFMLTNNAVIMMVVLIVFGVKIIGEGISGLGS
jgi:threonine/homoserine/homoserine lactone efflux protein